MWELKKGCAERHCCVQVMGELFCCLHRAELGGEAERCPDPQLPVRVRLPAAGRDEGGRPLSGALQLAAPRRTGPRSIVQTLFGLDVQARGMPAAPNSVCYVT